MASSIVALDAMLFDNPIRAIPRIKAGTTKRFLVKNYSPKSLKIGGKVGAVGPTKFVSVATRAPAAGPATISDCDDGHDFDDFLYSNTFSLSRTINIEGKIYTRMEAQEEERHWKFTIGCNLPGKWVLRWGVHFLGDSESEWDQPPHRMRPPGSVAVKDYAIDTPMMDVNSLEEGECFQEVNIDINTSSAIASINFVLRDEETGLSYQHLGGELRMPLVNNLQEGSGLNAAKWAFSFLQDDQEQPSSNGIDSSDQLGELVEEQPSTNVIDSSGQLGEVVDSHKLLEGFYEEQNVLKEITLENSVMVSVRKCGETDENLVCIETDFLEDVLVHWAICRDDQRRWELPTLPYPPDTVKFKNKALRTRLQPKEDGQGNIGYFTLENDLVGLLFVIRLNDDTWLKYMGNAFFIPLQTQTTTPDLIESLNLDAKEVQMSKNREEEKLENSRTVYTKGLIKNIRSLVSDISSENNLINRSKNNQEDILSEIEKLAAEAYSIFTSPSVPERTIKESDSKLPTVQLHSGTGNGYEILCQGFNWESHESGSWYMELHDKADYLSSLGFTIIWLPPPTESISPEGYMPKDLYNLDSRYGNIDELKAVIVKFHEVGIKVLGDVVLNHRCADYQNHNGVWNIFGGHLNWDDRAVVGDDPHFQGRGNKSSGDNFHAAPNIDHSQDFVRRDITEWMCWLKNEVGYDGWRLDFVRGFWGGYVRDYLKATEPYFAVGEYWDSLSYTYSEMDYDQSAHRQRIIDWINATGGYSGAFDVTTKGVLHSAVGDCQYWRLRDGAGQPPGVVGWWPSRAVTFIENHDTGSTQGHWRFPGGKEMQGYAYILTHPGTPSIFYDHLYSPLMDEISSLIALRRRNKLHCRSHIKIMKAEDKVYAAIVDDKVAMKIGPGHYEPPSDQEWSLAVEGECYKVWETVPR